jgi:hypothetical protein
MYIYNTSDQWFQQRSFRFDAYHILRRTSSSIEMSSSFTSLAHIVGNKDLLSRFKVPGGDCHVLYIIGDRRFRIQPLAVTMIVHVVT